MHSVYDFALIAYAMTFRNEIAKAWQKLQRAPVGAVVMCDVRTIFRRSKTKSRKQQMKKYNLNVLVYCCPVMFLLAINTYKNELQCNTLALSESSKKLSRLATTESTISSATLVWSSQRQCSYVLPQVFLEKNIRRFGNVLEYLCKMDQFPNPLIGWISNYMKDQVVGIPTSSTQCNSLSWSLVIAKELDEPLK